MFTHTCKYNKLYAFSRLHQIASDARSLTENNEALQDQLFQIQNQNSMLCKQIGKILRSVVKQKQIKLSLATLVNKSNLDYILAGIKGCQDVVSELNLSENGLDDEDLFKICDRL